MKIKKIKMRVEITINDKDTLIRTSEYDAIILSSLLYPEMFRQNCDLLSRDFQRKFASKGYEF